MKNLTDKDQSDFYEMDDRQIRDNVRSAHAYSFEQVGHNQWLIHYYKKKYGNKTSPYSTGHIYILKNQSIPGILKIGFTERSVHDRVNEINTATGVITPWIVCDFWFCDQPYAKEKIIHDLLREYRVEDNREGFSVSLEYAKEIILQTLNIK